jgi:hypothetical protein
MKPNRKALIAAALVAAIGLGGMALNLPPPVIATAQQFITALFDEANVARE